MRIFFLILVVYVYSNAGAVELAPPPVKSFHGLAQWRDRVILTVPKSTVFHVRSDTHLRLDEIVIEGTIVTNGFSFIVDTYKLKFGEQGSIKAFNAPAPTGPTGIKGADGTTSASTGGRGGNGKNGKIGGNGVDGLQKPGAIVIHAVEIVGKPNIDGTGQDGGQGGEGGPGGRGGQGGKGKNAYSNCGGKREHGGHGGPGGQGGKGGKGGIGGRGGAPVPVILVAGYEQSTFDSSGIHSGPGAKGEKGNAGEPGGKGAGGAGGEPMSKSCAWGAYTVSADRGQKGPDGPEQTATLGDGSLGAEAPGLDNDNTFLKLFGEFTPTQTYSMREFNEQRLDVAQRWFHFHWARSYFILVNETLSQVHNSNTDFSLDLSTQELVDSILTSVNDDRIELLIFAWENHFIKNLKTMIGDDDGGLSQNSLQAANKVVAFLKELQKENSPEKKQALRELLDSIKGKVDVQFRTTLESSIFACKKYVSDLKDKKFTADQVSLYYTIPVCLGEPDFKLAENFDKEIPLFVNRPTSIPSDWLTFMQEIARLDHETSKQKWKRPSILNWIIPKAIARTFEVEADEQLVQKPEDLKKVVPSREWVVAGQGVLEGYPKIKNKLTMNEIRNQLVKLSQSLLALEVESGEQ